VLTKSLPREVEVFIGAVTLAAAGLVFLLAPTIDVGRWFEYLLFFSLIALAPVFPIPDARGGYVTAAGTLLYTLIALHEPGAALVIAWFSFVVGSALSRGWIPWKTVSNGARLGISVAIGGLVFRAAGGAAGDPTIASLLVPLLAAILIQEAVNTLLVAFYFSQVRKTPLLATWLQDLRDLTFQNILSLPTAALLIILYVSIGPLVLLLYLVSLPLQRRAYHLLSQTHRIYGQAIDSLVLAIDANFPQGRGHSRRVADMATAIAREMKLPDAAAASIELAALIHDVGLIGLDEVLLTSVGSDDVKRLHDHPTIGANMMRDLPNRAVARIVRHHHERHDGTGYPEGLKGGRIPLGARIVAVAEVFDSLVSGGLSSAKPLSLAEAVERIASESGKAFDPRVVDAFLRVWRQASSSWWPSESLLRDAASVRGSLTT
jgi:hypothetical protein